MCGIAGKVSGSGPVHEELLHRMCSVIEHRGPDSRGVYAEGPVGLGIQRLRIIDLQTGDQPVFNEDGSVVVVLNGEIYNYRELRDELTSRGHRFSTGSDTETIVHAYEQYGDACVNHLRGMFAFALWDRASRRLLLARDRIGKKPLFYAQRGDTLWFGSEAKAILQDEDVDRSIDLDAIDAYLHFQYVPHPLSAFAALRKLPPAHMLVWERGRVELKRYWRLSYRRRNDAANEAEAHELIREKLLEATRLRLRSDVPLGAFLSGGVDSSAVVAAMAKQSEGRVKTFSIGFDVDAYDETRHAREVAELFDTDHHELRVEPKAMDVLPRLVWHYGEPFADSSAIPSFYLAELTRAQVTVALNGDGGDESFAGYNRYIGSGLADRLAGLPAPARRSLALAARLIGPDSSESSFRSRLDRLARTSSMTGYERYAMWMAYFTERERERMYTPELRGQLRDRTAPTIVRDPWLASDADDRVNRLLDVDVNTYLPGDLLVKMDIASMAHSLEVRSPLLDHEFMELCAGFPGEWKLSSGTTKKLFKDALRPWLPNHLLDRPKWGFGVPINTWLRGPLRKLPGEILLDPRSIERNFFREEYVRGLIDDHVAGTRDNANRLWALIQLELWLRTFVDRRANGPLTLDLALAA
ncbi:MAG TPA: asparagine synthase (glutamine-hydrolyzing) [Galbitalea sp.]